MKRNLQSVTFFLWSHSKWCSLKVVKSSEASFLSTSCYPSWNIHLKPEWSTVYDDFCPYRHMEVHLHRAIPKLENPAFQET